MFVCEYGVLWMNCPNVQCKVQSMDGKKAPEVDNSVRIRCAPSTVRQITMERPSQSVLLDG